MHREIPQIFGQKPSRFQLFAYLQASVVADRSRWPLWLPVLLGGGIGFYFSLLEEPPIALGWGVAAIFAALAWLFVQRGESGRAIVMAGFCAFMLGIAVAGLRTWWVEAPVLTHEIGTVSITGQVTQVEMQTSGVRVILQHLSVPRLSPDQTPAQVRITLQGKQPAFEAGDWLRLRAQLSPPSEPVAPGAFDFQRQSYFQRLGGIGFAFGPAEVIGHAPSGSLASLEFGMQRLRVLLSARVQAYIPGAAGAVAAALTTGTRSAIPEAELEAMRASGLAHLLAISGLHVGLVTGIIFFAVRAILALIPVLALRFPIKKWAAVCAIAGALFYALIAGATVPTQRAFLMVTLVLVAVLVDRRALSMRSVAWAALAVLLVAPEALLGASFQLSFAAVVALIAVYEALRGSRWLQSRDDGMVRSVLRYGAGVALTTLVAGLATATFGAYHFNRVANYSLAANMIAIPVTALWIMPWGVLAFALMPLGVEGFALIAMGWGVELVLWVAKIVTAWPGAQIVVPTFPTWGLAVFTFGGLWAAIWRGRWRYWGVLPALLGLASVLLIKTPDVLIDASGKLAAVKMPTGGYSVSTLMTKKFEREIWLRRAGLTVHEGRWPKARQGADQAIRCDALGCVYHWQSDNFSKLKQVAFVTAPEAMMEDCANATVVVNLSGRADQTKCLAPVHITLNDLSANGAHALYFDDQVNGRQADGGQAGVRVETVRERRGNRPWVLKSAR